MRGLRMRACVRACVRTCACLLEPCTIKRLRGAHCVTHACVYEPVCAGCFCCGVQLREELRPAGGAAPTRDVAVGINKVLEYGDGPRLPLPAAGAAECSSSDSGAGEGGAAAAHSTVLEDELTLYQLFDYLVTRAREAQLVMPHLRQELKLPAGRPAAGGAGAGGKSNGRGSSQLHSQPQLQPEPLTASLVEVVTPPCGGGGHDHGHGPAGRVGQAAETDAELAAAAVISRLKLREAPVETPLLRDRKGEHRKLPHHHLKLDVWYVSAGGALTRTAHIVVTVAVVVVVMVEGDMHALPTYLLVPLACGVGVGGFLPTERVARATTTHCVLRALARNRGGGAVHVHAATGVALHKPVCDRLVIVPTPPISPPPPSTGFTRWRRAAPGSWCCRRRSAWRTGTRSWR